MAFFYLPDLVVVDALVRATGRTRHPAFVWVSARILAAGSAVLCVGTYYFGR